MPAMDEHGNTYPPRSNEMEEYKQYETAPVIADKWHDNSVIGLCHGCLMPDVPLVLVAQDSSSSNKCKWCAELDNLNYHLQHNGERRMVEINKILNPDMHWSIKVFCVLVTIYVLYVIFVSGTH